MVVEERVWQAQPRQAEFMARQEDEVLYGGAAGGGKLLALETPIPTPDGWSTIGQLSPGDYVFDAQGHPTQVEAIYLVNFAPDSYHLTFDDGAALDACSEHRWLTFTAADLAALTRRHTAWRAERRSTRNSRVTGSKSERFTTAIVERNRQHPPPSTPPPTGSIRTTAEILATLRTPAGRANHAIPLAEPLDLPHRSLPLDPYVLGLWLGDGTTRAGQITSHTGNGDQETIRTAIERAGFQTTDYPSIITFGVPGLQTVLRAIGVLGNKHVPTIYLRASAAQRLALLQGIMDTDGHACASGSVEFTTTLRQLAHDVHELAVSLGWKAAIHQGRATLHRQDCGPKYRLKWSPDKPVFRLPRKLAVQRLDDHRRTVHWRYVTAVEPIPPKPMRCIKVATPSGLFLAGFDMIPTHNTDALLADAIRLCIEHPGARTMFLRRTFKDLSRPGSAIDRSKEMLTEVAEWRGSEFKWEFDGGGVLAFAHLENPGDVYSYQGTQIDGLYWDEITQFAEDQFQFLRSRVRATVPGVRPRIRAATNPGNVGHGWVRKRWVDAAPWGHPFSIRAENGTVVGTGCFIPARVADNRRLLERDPGYATRLEGLPEHLRRAYLDGDWDIFAGQVFTEWRRDKHVVRPFNIPKEWPRWMGVDFGYGAPWCALWLARAPGGTVYVYREAYQKGLSDRDQAKKIRRESHGEDVKWVVADPSAFSKQPNGKSIADVYFEAAGIRLSRGNNDRLSGLQRLHEYLRPGVEGLEPSLQVFDTCQNLIRTLPALVYDDHKVEDVDSSSDDHAYDALRYACMAAKLKPPAGPVLRDFVATM